MSEHKNHILLTITLLVIGWGLLVVVNALRADWSGPIAPPPEGNPSSFLTSGPNPETKTGQLMIDNNFYVTGNTSLGSTATPTSARVVITPVSNAAIDAGNGSIRTTYLPSDDYDVVTKTYLASSLSGSSYWLLSGGKLFPSSTSWNVGIGTTSPTANFQVDGSSLFNGLVFINTDPNNSNDSSFEYGNGYNPAVSNYDNQKFRINSFFESPFVSMGVALNYLLRSEAFDNSSWTKTGIGTVTADSAAAPNGRVTAENIPAGSSDTANIAQTVTNTTTGYWAAGVWARATGTPTATIKLRLDSSSETGTEVTFNLDNTWRFYSIKQNFTAAHTNKTFRIITGTNTVSLWGARMNPGESVNAYYYTTSSGLTSPYMGVFFNFSNVYASTFSGSLSGNASSANYASGLYGGFSISNDTDKTNKWEYIGYMYLVYSSTYRYGQSWNVELKVKELDRRGTLTPDNYGETTIRMQGKMPAVANSTEFNTTTPQFTVNIDGNGGLSPDDVAMLVYSSDTSAKYIRLYVRLKNPDSHYIFVPINQYGASYSSSGSISNGYCYYTSMGNQAATTNLPTPAQGSIVYATQRFDSSDFWRSNNNDIYNANSGNVGIGTTSPSAALHIYPRTDTEGVRIVSSNYSPLVIRNSSDTADLFRVNQSGDVTAVTSSATKMRSNNYCDATGANCFNPSSGWSTGISTIFLTTTTTAGSFSWGGAVGYDAGNKICANEQSGSHFCRTDEIIYLIQKNGTSSFSAINGQDAWIADGPPGYTGSTAADDCAGWTNNTTNNLGHFWIFSTAGGGRGALIHCGTVKKIACCK